MTLSTDRPITVLDALLAALNHAGRYNRDAESPPLAILWPDGGRHWESVIPILRQQLLILTLGDFDRATMTGPAIWIRGELVRAASAGTPIIYLPGVGKDVFRSVEDAPDEIQPLLYLQYRGTIFLQPNGKDWTLPAFFQNAQHGLGVRVDGGEATRAALVSAATHLLNRSVPDLRDHPGGLDAAFLNQLLISDMPRTILDWIDDPASTRDGLTDAVWMAFRQQLRKEYQLDPERDGPSEAARLLGEARVGTRWDTVWKRFAEAPENYERIPDRLRGARPGAQIQPTLFGDESAFHWPQDNEEGETALREALLALDGMADPVARAKIAELEAAHARRRSCVWAKMGQAPLATALQHLARVAEWTSATFPAGRVATMREEYTTAGWRVDAAALDALAATSHGPDREAVESALDAIYTPWLATTATHFQEAMRDEKGTGRPTPLAVPPGTCVLFADGLRYDLAARLGQRLKASGTAVELSATIGALPGVTPTAKPAQSPVTDRLGPGPKLTPTVSATGTVFATSSFRKLLVDAGWRYLEYQEIGEADGSGRAWTELGAIDSYGHNAPGDLPQQAGQELERLHQRTMSLLAAGWSSVLIVTDHGWLLTPKAMPKTDLPIHLTAERKGRCARLEPGASVSLQTVPWAWDTGVQIAMAPGISCFEVGKRYEHGGLSMQECIVPAITVTGGRDAATSQSNPRSVSFRAISWRGLRCMVEIDAIDAKAPGLSVDIRRRAGDASTSLATSPQKLKDGGARILIGDDSHEAAPAIIVVLDESGTAIAQRATIIGGE